MKPNPRHPLLIRPILLLSLAITILVFSAGCRKPPEGIIKVVIQPGMEFSHSLYYWETIDGRTDLFKLTQYTSDITNLKYGLKGVRDIQTSETSIYILTDDRDGYLRVVRLESDEDITTTAVPEIQLKAVDDKPWTVGWNDVVALSGVDDAGKYHAITLEFERKIEGDPDHPGSDLTPKISWIETEWIATDQPVGELSLSDNSSILAIALPLEEGSDHPGLYLMADPGGTPVPLLDKPVVEMGGFSPDSSRFIATFDIEERVELYMFRMDNLENERLTRSTRFYLVENPSWHPGGRYIMYTTNFTTAYTVRDAPLSGDQLFNYSLDSRNARRLTNFQGQQMHIDFARNGDFLLYSSTLGADSQRGGRSIAITSGQDGTVNMEEIEIWRLYLIPWIQEDFATGASRMIQHNDTQLVVSWAVLEDDEIGFAWGPGGEWDPSVTE